MFIASCPLSILRPPAAREGRRGSIAINVWPRRVRTRFCLTYFRSQISKCKYKALSTKFMGIENFIRDALLQPHDLIAYHVGRELAELHPEKTIIEGQTWYFDLEEFVRAEKCFIVEDHSVFNHVRTDWEGIDKKQEQVLENSWLQVLWNDRLFEVVLITWTESCYRRRHHWIVAESRAFAESFVDAVCDFSCEVRGQILVYRDGFFEKDKELFDSIKGSTFDNLILDDAFKVELQNDFFQFFQSRETYERYAIPWKRGAVFIGPPGNGKTHTVKALINQLGKPCIYVRSFKADYGTEQEKMREVFERARMTAPCVVILEDLDAMINDENRAFFLNELDGFEVNTGVVVIATTNHPDKLDPAILDRPSRFDRKYYFNLPNENERLAYLNSWNKQLQAELRVSDTAMPGIASGTDRFSFAYLKELLLSSMVQWMTNQGTTSMDEIMCKQVESLRNQMSSSEVRNEYRTLRRFALFERAANLFGKQSVKP
jgi:AAA+ superfamily predicted ATPase